LTNKDLQKTAEISKFPSRIGELSNFQISAVFTAYSCSMAMHKYNLSTVCKAIVNHLKKIDDYSHLSHIIIIFATVFPCEEPTFCCSIFLPNRELERDFSRAIQYTVEATLYAQASPISILRLSRVWQEYGGSAHFSCIYVSCTASATKKKDLYYTNNNL